LKAVIAGIAISNVYEVSYTVGFVGTVLQLYHRFRQLPSIATDQWLTDLATQHMNAVVRLYALQAIKQRHTNISDSLPEQFQNNKTIAMTLNGCNGNKKTVSEVAKLNLKSANDLTYK
jgi:hypothetical protein